MLSVLAGLALLEIVLRSFDLFEACYYGEAIRYARDAVPDPELIYRHRPHWSTVYQHVDVAYNELGLRERPLRPKAPGSQRILLLGDSVVFGWGVKIEQTVGRRLERLLAARGIAAETINSGVCSYNTVQQQRFFRRHGASLAADAVVLLYVENDIHPLPPLQTPRFSHSPDWSPPELAAQLFRASLVTQLGYHIGRLALADRDAAWNPALPAYQASMRALARIAARCRRQGIPFAVFLYRMEDSRATARLLQSIQRTGSENGFLATDTLPWFEGRKLRRLTNSLIDTHPNAAGNHILAEGVGEFLVSRGVLSGSRTQPLLSAAPAAGSAAAGPM